jgi:hypothetical protein
MSRLLRAPSPTPLLFAALCGGCTLNYYRHVDQSSDLPIVKANDIQADCRLDWEGAAPRGWTVATVKTMVGAIPRACEPPAILVHSGAGSVDWETGDTGDVDGLVVRAAVMELRRRGTAVERRIHLFTGASAESCFEAHSCPPPVVIVRQGPRGWRGRPGRTGSAGATVTGPPGPVGPIGPIGPISPQIVPAEGGAPGEPGAPGQAGKGDGISRIVRAIPPAAVGGGLVYTLMYLNLLSVPGAAAPVRGIRKPPPPELDDEGDQTVAATAAAAAATDPRVRVSSARFEDGAA